jgi:hypothetical protein
MTKEEIKEKYGIELICKEMWVWDSGATNAVIMFVVVKDSNTNFPYVSYSKNNVKLSFRNASETNPNEPKQPQVGDIGYFWDDEESYLCSVLKNIVNDGRPAYYCSLGFWFTNFSKEKQPWMK